jgi:hypothetical protein
MKSSIIEHWPGFTSHKLLVRMGGFPILWCPKRAVERRLPIREGSSLYIYCSGLHPARVNVEQFFDDSPMEIIASHGRRDQPEVSIYPSVFSFTSVRL